MKKPIITAIEIDQQKLHARFPAANIEQLEAHCMEYLNRQIDVAEIIDNPFAPADEEIDALNDSVNALNDCLR